MGQLSDFDVGRFGCNVFFETGTGRGDSLRFAVKSGFERIYSVEIDMGTFLRYAVPIRVRWLLRDITVIRGPSVSVLRRQLPFLSPRDRILFFLDAHYPGEHSRCFRGYGAVQDKNVRLPLQKELETISELRSGCRDVILVDDLRIYEHGPYEDGNTPAWAETLAPQEKNIDFVRGLFPGHELHRDYRKQGYLIVLPRADHVQ